MDTIYLEETIEEVIKMDVIRSFPDLEGFDSEVFLIEPRVSKDC